MSNQTPQVQHAIRMLDFFIDKIEMSNNNAFDRTVTDKLELKISLGVGFPEDPENNTYTVDFDVLVKNEPKEFQLRVHAIALFESKEAITEEFKVSPFVKMNSPAIAFPFVRSFLNTLTSNAGLNPVILPSYNFNIEDTDNQ